MAEQNRELVVVDEWCIVWRYRERIDLLA